MAEVLLFVQSGWQNIWKQKTIWLFSTLSVISSLFIPTYSKGEQNLSLLCLYLVVYILSLVLFVISFIGVPYQAFRFSTGAPATAGETLAIVKTFGWRIIGCSAFGILLLAPCFLLILGIALKNSTQPSQVSTTLVVAFMPLSICSCLWDFTIFGFFENDWGIRRSIGNAWALFISHFSTLALLGILILVFWRVGFAMAGILTILIQSGSDVESLSTLNYLNPSITLSKNLLFELISGVIEIIFNTFSASVYVLAYLKYR